MYLKTTGLVAQPVERWTPCGGSIRPGYESSGFEARRALDIYVIPGGYGRGKWAMASRSQSKSVMADGTGRAWLYAYVKGNCSPSQHVILSEIAVL